MNARSIALRILQAWDKKPGLLDLAIERELSRAPSTTATGLRVRTGERRGAPEAHLDHVLGQFVQDAEVLDNEYVMRILEMEHTRSCTWTECPTRSVNETVELTRLAKRTMHAPGW